MQTKQGKTAQAPVSSELAAMFCIAVLPKLRDIHKKGRSNEQYRQECKDFAQLIGLPKAEWGRVTIPCFMSFDWDTSHTFLRYCMGLCRLSDKQLKAFDDAASRPVLRSFLNARVPYHDDPVEDDSVEDRSFNLLDGIAAAGRKRQQDLRAQKLFDAEKALILQKYAEDWENDVVLSARWEAALNDHRFLTMHERQYMPLSKVSPDVHSPVEHMVSTLKRTVRQEMLALELFNDSLWKGRTYQQFIEKAVETRGRGEAGRTHIRGSVDKQIIICRVLAANPDELVEFDYAFNGAKHATRWVIPGFAGNWITDNRLT